MRDRSMIGFGVEQFALAASSHSAGRYVEAGALHRALHFRHSNENGDREHVHEETGQRSCTPRPVLGTAECPYQGRTPNLLAFR